MNTETPWETTRAGAARTCRAKRDDARRPASRPARGANTGRAHGDITMTSARNPNAGANFRTLPHLLDAGAGRRLGRRRRALQRACSTGRNASATHRRWPSTLRIIDAYTVSMIYGHAVNPVPAIAQRGADATATR